MLDAFKKGSAATARQQLDELRALVAASREERAALSTMLTQVQQHSARLAASADAAVRLQDTAAEAEARITALQQAIDARLADVESLGDKTQAAADVLARLEGLERRAATLAARESEIGRLEKRATGLRDLSAGVERLVAIQAQRLAEIEELRGALDGTRQAAQELIDRSGDLARLQANLAGGQAAILAIAASAQSVEERQQAILQRLDETEQRLRNAAAAVVADEGRDASAARLAQLESGLATLTAALESLAGRVDSLAAPAPAKGRRRTDRAEPARGGSRAPAPDPGRTAVHEVQSRTVAIADMLADVRESLEALGGRGPLIEQAVADVSELRSKIEEAQDAFEPPAPERGRRRTRKSAAGKTAG
jgi:chromosome segregation ATPase